MLKNCLTCGKEFKTFPCNIKKGKGKYCSNKCKPPTYGRRGKTHSLEVRQKMSKAHTIRKGENHPSWKGGKRISNHGYIHIYSPCHPSCNANNCIAEHRLVIEKQIGRYLDPEEVVHHRGKKDDNRPHMLMAFINNAVHTRFHGNPDNVKLEEIIFDGRKNNSII